MVYGLFSLKGKITAVSPIFHGGNEKTGSVVLLNRIKYLVNGKAMDVPFISGNEVRGYLRRLLMQDYLELAGYKIDLEKKQGQALFHTLFSGGILESVESESSSGVIDLSRKREIWQNILPLRLLGCSFSNQMIEGKLKVSHMLPICKELKDFLPQEYCNSEQSFYTFITREFQTRRDDLRAEREKDEQATQMLIEQEVFAPGTQFYHEFVLEDPDALCLGTLARMVLLWEANPYIGGKSSIGLGRLKIEYHKDGLPADSEYVKFSREHAEKIREVLAKLEDSFTKKGKAKKEKEKEEEAEAFAPTTA